MSSARNMVMGCQLTGWRLFALSYEQTEVSMVETFMTVVAVWKIALAVVDGTLAVLTYRKGNTSEAIYWLIWFVALILI